MSDGYCGVRASCNGDSSEYTTKGHQVSEDAKIHNGFTRRSLYIIVKARVLLVVVLMRQAKKMT